MSSKINWTGIWFVIIGASSYGILSPIIKLAYEAGYNELQVTAAQFVLGSLVLWFMVLVQPKSWGNPFKGPWIQMSLIGIFGLAATAILLNLALASISTALAIVLLFQFVWITILLELVIGKKRPTRNQMIAVAIVLAGTVFAVGLSVEDIRRLEFLGVLFGFLSSISYSVFIYFTGKLKTDMHPLLKSAIMQTAPIPFALPLLMILLPDQSFIPDEHAAGLLFWGGLIALVGIVLPTLFFNMGLPKITSALGAMLGSVELPVAVIGALLLLQEPVKMLQWLGIAGIIAGIVISEWRPRKRNRST